MFRVLLVDDEPWDLLGMKKGFPWDETGFSVIGQTTDSVEALSIILRETPDVVFTDIRMPEISGIELIKQSRDNNIKSEFIVVSGYAEFEYAKEVIKFGGYYYLLKPVDLDEVRELLKKLSIHLKQKQFSDKLDTEHFNENQVDFYKANESFKKLLNYVNNNYFEEISLNGLSEKFHLNITYICDLFKEIMDTTLLEYITELRMKKACSLLRETMLSIAEIAKKSGYNDYYYFNKVFKKNLGVPPGKYRRGD